MSHAHVIHDLFDGGEMAVSQPVTLIGADEHISGVLEEAKFGFGADNVQVLDGDIRSGAIALLITDGEAKGKDRIAEIVMVAKCACSAARKAVKPKTRSSQIVPEPATG